MIRKGSSSQLARAMRRVLVEGAGWGALRAHAPSGVVQLLGAELEPLGAEALRAQRARFARRKPGAQRESFTHISVRASKTRSLLQPLLQPRINHLIAALSLRLQLSLQPLQPLAHLLQLGLMGLQPQIKHLSSGGFDLNAHRGLR